MRDGGQQGRGEGGLELGWSGSVVTLNGMVVGMCGMD